MTQSTLSQLQMVLKLKEAGYNVDVRNKTITPPAQPQRQQVTTISESMSDAEKASRLREFGYQVREPWLPSSLAGKGKETWKAMADRRVPWAQVAKEDHPDDILAACCSMLVVDRLMSQTDRARLDPSTEI